MSDKELIRLLKRNPAKGFDMMTKVYGGLVYAVVRGRLSPAYFGAVEIEDTIADVFSDFYLSLDRFQPDKSSIKSYLCVMARNKAADILRKRKITELPLKEAEDLLDVADDLEDSVLRADLLREIKNLGEPDSLILIRKYYLGQSSKDIAVALDLSSANVDTRAHRAIAKLRKVFGGIS